MDSRPSRWSGTQEPIPNPSSGSGSNGPAGTPGSVGPLVRIWYLLRWLVSTRVGGGLIVLGAIIVAIALFRDQLTGYVGALRVGDCIDLPRGSETVTDVRHHPCNEAHDAEVFFVGTYPAADAARYPSTVAFSDFFGGNCLPAFQAYTGSIPVFQSALEAGYFYPTQDGWTHAKDHGFSCYLHRADGQKATQSYKGANP